MTSLALILPEDIKSEFSVNHLGVAKLSLRCAARLLGISEQVLSKNLKTYDNRKPSKLAETLATHGIDSDNLSFNGITDTAFAIIAYYYATSAQKVTEEAKAVCLVFMAIGARTAIQKALGWVSPEEQERVNRIKELEVQVQALKLQKENKEIDHAMLCMHGAATVLALRGHSDQVVEVEKPIIEIIDNRHNVRFRGMTLKQLAEYSNKKNGTRFKNGGELKRFLEKSGKDDCLAQTLRSVPSEYIPEEYVEDVVRFLSANRQQKLLGE